MPSLIVYVIIGVIALGLIATIVVTVVKANAPSKKAKVGESCGRDEECEGWTADGKVRCHDKPTGLCTDTDGKFQNGGACVLKAGQRMGVCNTGYFCGGLPLKCMPLPKKLGGLCPYDTQSEETYTDVDGTVKKATDVCKGVIGLDGKPTDDAKCSPTGYCEVPIDKAVSGAVKDVVDAVKDATAMQTEAGGACSILKPCDKAKGYVCCGDICVKGEQQKGRERAGDPYYCPGHVPHAVNQPINVGAWCNSVSMCVGPHAPFGKVNCCNNTCTDKTGFAGVCL